jgi:hypothetical protein
MMKLRLLPIIITVLTSSVVLFGGWFIYHSMAVESPMNKVISQVQGVQSVSTNVNNTQVTVNLQLKNDADIRNLYRKISDQGGSLLGSRELKLNLASNTSPQLEAWWSSALFEVAQAMETKQYAKIPAALQAKAGQVPNLKVDTAMDETNVYVRLTQGDFSKYIILPRTPAQIGVWKP